MQKKKQGQRFKSLFDELDLKILTILLNKPQGVLSLTKALNVEHKTAKNHIDKLEGYQFIKIENLPQNKKLLELSPSVRIFMLGHKLETGKLTEKEHFEKLMKSVINLGYRKIDSKEVLKEIS